MNDFEIALFVAVHIKSLVYIMMNNTLIRTYLLHRKKDEFIKMLRESNINIFHFIHSSKDEKW